jgi:hypothetical protein
MAINPNPPPRNILLLFSEVIDLYTRMLPINPINKTVTPKMTISKPELVIKGLKNPESNAKNAIK